MGTQMMHMPPVVVDEGDVTVLRRMAAYTWGTYKVTWPEGFEPPELAPDRELGFVAKLPTEEGGRFSRRFVRADAQVDAANGYSNVETILDDAEGRTGGDVFLERDITTAGLGHLVPYTHFGIGDVIPVRIWGRVIHLPVTSIDEVTEPGNEIGWRVHVGGQLIADVNELDATTSELERVIAQERRERIGADDAVRVVANEAQSVAEGAQESTDELTTDLTGDVDTPVDEAVEHRTGALGGIQRSVDQAQTEQLILHDNQLKWLRWTKTQYNFGFSQASGESQNVSDSVETGLVDVIINEVADMGTRCIVRPGWRGTYRVESAFTDGTSLTIHGRARGNSSASATQYRMDKTVLRASVQVWPDHGVDPREWAVQVQRNTGGDPQFIAPAGLGVGDITLTDEGFIKFSVPVSADHTVLRNGVVPVESGESISQNVEIAPSAGETSGVVVFAEVMPQLQWDVGIPLRGSQTVQIPSLTVRESSRVGTFYYSTVGTWTAPSWGQPVRATITYSIRWAKYDAWALADYRTRVQVNGELLGRLTNNTTGGMNTHFTQSVTTTLRAGDEVGIFAGSQAGATSERRMSGNFTVSWQPL